MKVKEENKEKFIDALFNLGRSIKNETDNCSKLCGGASEKEIMVVIFVGQHTNVKMSDIADNISAPMSTLTNVVDKLVEKKLISRDHSGEDRRVINVSLTTAGKEAYKNILAQKKKIAERMLSPLNEKDQALAIRYINQLAEAIITQK